jgi:hypothetical protein
MREVNASFEGFVIASCESYIAVWTRCENTDFNTFRVSNLESVQSIFDSGFDLEVGFNRL